MPRRKENRKIDVKQTKKQKENKQTNAGGGNPGVLESPPLGIEVYVHLHTLLEICFYGGKDSGIFQPEGPHLCTKD